MDHVYQSNVSQIPPNAPYPGVSGFAQGNQDLTQFIPTTPGAFIYYHVTESIRNVIIGAGLTPDPTNLKQLAQAIEIFASGGP